jgi:hypothetical protein
MRASCTGVPAFKSPSPHESGVAGDLLTKLPAWVKQTPQSQDCRKYFFKQLSKE